MSEKTYRPKSGVDNLTLSYPLGGKHKTVSEWPLTTESREEQRYLDSVEVLTDRPRTGFPVPSGGGEKSLSRMNKGELIAEAKKRGVPVNDTMTKAEIVQMIEVNEEPPADDVADGTPPPASGLDEENDEASEEKEGDS